METFDILGDSSLHQIETLTFKFDNYRLELLDSPWKNVDDVNIEKEWYIVGEHLSNSNEKRDYKNPDILLSLLNLGSNISKINNQLDPGSEEEQLLFSAEIIEWCNKHGLPYYEDFLQKHYKKHLFGFRIGDFKRQISGLYNRFEVYYGLTFNDLDLIKSYPICRLWDINTKSGLENLKEHYANDLWGKANISLKMGYNKDLKKFEMIPYTDNFIEIAYFQIGMLLIGEQEEKIKYCSHCGRIFIFYHGKEAYCSECKPMTNALKQKRHQDKVKATIMAEYANGTSVEVLSNKYKKTESQIKKWLHEC